MNETCYVSICIDFDVEDGLMAGIQIGVNATPDYTDDEYCTVAADYYAGGNETLHSEDILSGTIPSGTAPTDA
jgi:hypothetical protein